MPKSAQEVDALLAQVKARRDEYDSSGETLAAAKEEDATALMGEAQEVETRIAALDLKNVNDQAAYRALSANAGGKRQQAQRALMNAHRIRSLNHAAEKANGTEVCIRCTPMYDDAGDVVGATHYRVPVEDTTVTVEGQPVTHRGLKGLLRDGDADVDADGDLVIGGRKVDPRPRPARP